MAMVSPGCGAERDAVERGQLRPPGIGKAYVVELDLAAGGDGQGDGKRRRLDLRLDGEQLGEAFGGARRLADLAPDFRDLREGGAGENGVEHELAQAADGHAAVDDGGGAEPQHAGDAGDDEEHGERREHGARAHALLGGVEGDLDVATVLVGGGPLVRERLHGARGGEVFGGVGGGLRQRILRAARQAAHRTPEGDERQHGERDGEQHQQREVRAGDEHHDERADEHDQAAQRLRERGSGDRLDLRRVGGEAAHQLAGVRALEECRAEIGDVAEHIRAQVGDDALAQPVDVVEARGAGEREDEADDDQHREVFVDEDAVVRAKAEVDHAPHRHRNDEHRQGRDDERDGRERQLQLVTGKIGPQRQQGPQLGARLLALVALPMRGVGPV